jgi:hypothetical protein
VKPAKFTAVCNGSQLKLQLTSDIIMVVAVIYGKSICIKGRNT